MPLALDAGRTPRPETAGLRQEAADRLRLPASSLSGGKRRLCPAQALALEPAVPLSGEPVAPLASIRPVIEELLKGLAGPCPPAAARNLRQPADLAQRLAAMAGSRMDARFDGGIPGARETWVSEGYGYG